MELPQSGDSDGSLHSRLPVPGIDTFSFQIDRSGRKQTLLATFRAATTPAATFTPL
jgi:hypothetical protein